MSYLPVVFGSQNTRLLFVIIPTDNFGYYYIDIVMEIDAINCTIYMIYMYNVAFFRFNYS